MKRVGIVLLVAVLAAGAAAQSPQEAAPKVTAKPAPAQLLDEPEPPETPTPAPQPALHGGGTILPIAHAPTHQPTGSDAGLHAAAITLLGSEPSPEIAPTPDMAAPAVLVPQAEAITPQPVVAVPAPDPATEAVADIPAEPDMPAIEGPFASAPLPVAMTDVVVGTCLANLRGNLVLDQSLPADAVDGIGETIAGRMITRPQPGRIWTTRTLEGEMLLGQVEQRPAACQVLAVSPLGKLVMDEITEALMDLDSAFEIVDETGTDSGTPVHWRRLKSSDNEFIDILHYKGVPGGRASTLHVIVG
jgi:hypothetical protein